jgi:phosphatidylserine decarboxylase
MKPAFSAIYGDLSAAADGGFKSFNDFFSRSLKDKAKSRPQTMPERGYVIGAPTDFSPFEEFQRGYFIVDTGSYGHVAIVPVGLNTISSVVFEDKFKSVTEPVAVARGDELGHFLYGGSRYTSDAIQVRLGNQIGTFDTDR